MNNKQVRNGGGGGAVGIYSTNSLFTAIYFMSRCSYHICVRKLQHESSQNLPCRIITHSLYNPVISYNKYNT